MTTLSFIPFKLSSKVNTVFDAITLSKDGNTVFLGMSGGGIRIYDIRDKRNPVMLSDLDWEVIRPDFDDICLNRNESILYAAAGHEGLVIYNVKDYKNPVLLSHTKNPPIYNARGTTEDILITKDDRFVIMNVRFFGISIYDVTNSSQPILYGYLQTG